VYILHIGTTSITKEQLESILVKKLEQKLAPIKKSFEELQNLIVLTNGQYDALLCRVTSCEKENSMLKDENKILKILLAAWKLRSNLYSRQAMTKNNIHEEKLSKFEASLNALGNQPTTLSKRLAELWALRLLTTIFLQVTVSPRQKLTRSRNLQACRLLLLNL